ncbi:MAG: NAD(P)/FAD-dependent oxidoreductase [Bacteroidia bacterium]
MTFKITKNNNSPGLSYWELRSYFKVCDLIVIGSGIVGLSAAISFKKANKKARVLVLEKGIFPSGASTKNAGFCCFGSVSELLSDLEKMPESVVWETLKMRWDGLKLLRAVVGDKAMDYQQNGGFELFDNIEKFKACSEKIGYLNKEIQQITGKKNTYSDAGKKIKKFGFKNSCGLLLNRFEGQIQTDRMMERLIDIAKQSGVEILNNIQVDKLQDTGIGAELETPLGLFRAHKVIVAINGFAKTLLNLRDVNPARAQVLITKPIKNLKVKGTFHYEEGYYYFRDLDGRLLLGGGRNLDIKGETTTELAITGQIQDRLEKLLKTVIMPGTPYEIEHRWAGIMGVGTEKKPIIRSYSKNVVCAVRMGGMGIAIGSLVGKEAALLVQS